MLEIHKLPPETDFNDLLEISARMSAICKFEEISVINWNNFNYKPQVKFAVAYNNKELFIKYDVVEDALRAIETANNGKVWTDSCCEFFVSPDSNSYYYNFECNCIGTLLIGYRNLGDPTEHASDEIINSVRRFSSLGSKPFGNKTGGFAWNMILAIPFSAFFKHNIKSLEGMTFTANFYKCGDDMPVPHYLSWKPIRTEKPSFHQPAFFSEIRFK